MQATVLTASDSLLDRWLIIAGLFFALLGVFLLVRSNQELGFLENVSPIGDLTTAQTVKRRHARALAWGKIEKEGKLYPKDIVYTPPGATAEVHLNGSEKLYLSPESMVEFDTISNKGSQLVLLQGLARMRDKNNQEKELTVTAPEASLAPPVPAYQITPIMVDTVAWEKIQNTLLASARALPQQLSLYREEPVTLPDFRLNRLSDFALQALPPKLLSESAVADPWYRLEWNAPPVGDITYEVEISRAADFSRAIKHSTKNSFLEIQFLGNGKYLWRVTARSQKERSESPVQTLEVEK